MTDLSEVLTIASFAEERGLTRQRIHYQVKQDGVKPVATFGHTAVYLRQDLADMRERGDRQAAPCPRCGEPFAKQLPRCPDCGLSAYRAWASHRAGPWAQGRATQVMVDRHFKEYQDLYVSLNSQHQARTAIVKKYPQAYRKLYRKFRRETVADDA
jgi:hypothetical protein